MINSYSMICLGGIDETNVPKTCFGKSQRLRFLVVLDSDEFKQRGCWFLFSKIDAILQNARMFPGKIEVLPTEELNPAIHISSTRTFIKNRLYVRIPKERVYVPIEQFEEKYVFSQLSELNLLLLHLNAESVRLCRFKYDNEHEITSNKPIFGLHSGVDAYVKSMGANDSDDDVEIRYPIPKKCYTNIDVNKYSYREKWGQIIENRIKKNVVYDEFMYEYSRPAFMNVNEQLIVFLRSIGLNVFYSASTNDVNVSTNDVNVSTNVSTNDVNTNIQLFFEILYYPDEMIIDSD